MSFLIHLALLYYVGLPLLGLLFVALFGLIVVPGNAVLAAYRAITQPVARGCRHLVAVWPQTHVLLTYAIPGGLILLALSGVLLALLR